MGARNFLTHLSEIFGGSPREAEPLTDAERQAIAQGEADAAAGRVVPYADVKRWLDSWGKPGEGPTPHCKK